METDHMAIPEQRRRAVYELSDPTTGDVFYVGATWRFNARRAEHLRGRVYSTRARIAALAAADAEPEFRIVGYCTSAKERRALELRTVAQHLAAGVALCNPQLDHRLARERFGAIFAEAKPEPQA